MDPVTVPWSLTEIQGGSLNADKLCDHLLSTINSIHPISLNAASFVAQKFGNDPSVPLPPSYFKACSVISFSSEEEKIIQLEMLYWPVAVTVDGCSTNIAAGNKLIEKLGLLTPFSR